MAEFGYPNLEICSFINMPLIILDRDGVINYDSDDYIKSVDEFVLIPGSLEAIARLNQAGFKVAIATNQSGISRSYYTLDTLHAMHDKLAKLLLEHGGKIDKIYFCPHGPNEQCACRKPLPGMLQQAMNELESDPSDTIMIGDSIKDLAAAKAACITAMLVKTGKGERSLAKIKSEQIYTAIPIYADLRAATNAILN